jgi:hypothetical protein
MKKKKLLLNRESIRRLTTHDLHEVAGGAERTRGCDPSAGCTILPQIPDNTFPANPLPLNP